MFKFLKDKLKNAVSLFSKKVEEEGKEEIVEEAIEKAEKKTSKEIKRERKEPQTEKAQKKIETPQKKPKKEPLKKVTATIEKKKTKAERREKKQEKEEPEETLQEEPKPLEKAAPDLEKPLDVTPEKTEVYTEEEPVIDVQPETPKVEEKRGFFSRFFGKKTEEKVSEDETETPHKKTTAADEEEAREEGKTAIEETRATNEEEAIEEEEKPAPKETPPTEEKETARTVKRAAPEEKKEGFFGRLTQKIVAKEIDEKQFDELFWELEVGLLESNVAVEVIEKIKDDLKQQLVGKPIKRTQISETIEQTLKQSVEDLFVHANFEFLSQVKSKKPYIICFVGINGSGKTTTIAKVAKLLEGEGLSVVMAAADTFRAAAIDQLQTHADTLGIKLIKHDYGSDPAAVAFDAVKHAQARNVDVVLIDTAGRMHSNVNLLDEMKKIIRVAKPDLKIFVGESITGNDCIEQAKAFDAAISLDGIILAKADIDEKGGAALSVSYVTKKPILFLGTGQKYEDLKPFDKEYILKNLGF